MSGRGSAARAGSIALTLVLTAIVFLLALGSRMGIVDHPPIYDELYQLMPAVSWQTEQSFAVLSGIYDRAAPFTQLIAFSFDVFNERSVAAARMIPTVLPGAALVAIMFFWARQVAGIVPACITAFFLILWPNGIEVSQYIRFYALQGLCFVSAAILIYTALTVRWGLIWRGLLLVAAAALLLLALRLQMMTLIGAGAIGLWVAIVLLPGWLRAYPKLWFLLAGGVLLVGGVLASGVINDTLVWMWTTYQWEPWPPLNDTFFYHRDFRDNYPTFWPLFPIAAIIALRANFKVASFCLILFAVTFVIQSFGGLKNIRYLYPTMPFFFLMWGIAIQAVLPVVWRHLRGAADMALTPVLPKGLARLGGFAMLGVGALFLVAANAAFERAGRLIAGNDENILLGKVRWHWAEAREMVEPWLQESAVVITTEEMRAVQTIGDFDLAFNKPRFSELLYSMGPDTQPFTPDRRTGRPLAGEVSDMGRVIACAPVGVLISDAPWVGSGNARALERLAEQTGAETVLTSNRGMAMLGWRRVDGTSDAEACAGLPDLSSPGAAERILSGESQPRPIQSSATE